MKKLVSGSCGEKNKQSQAAAPDRPSTLRRLIIFWPHLLLLPRDIRPPPHRRRWQPTHTNTPINSPTSDSCAPGAHRLHQTTPHLAKQHDIVGTLHHQPPRRMEMEHFHIPIHPHCAQPMLPTPDPMHTWRLVTGEVTTASNKPPSCA